MEEFAKALVKKMSGKIESKFEIDGQVDDAKASFMTAMTLPGLAAVTLAIVNEGSKTRKVLGKILSENKSQTDLMKGNNCGVRTDTL